LNNLARINFEKGNVAKAKELALRSLTVANELKFPSNIRGAAETLYLVYQQENKPAQALEMYTLYIQMRDSINNEQTRKASLKKQFQIEFDDKEKEVKLVAAAEKKIIEEKAEEERKRKNIIIYSVILGLLLVCVFSVFIFRSLQKNKKANVIITKQKAEVEAQKHLIEEHQKEIMDSINYAKRIQFALLSSDTLLENNLPEHFVLFKPKDVVSGDFYWATPTPDGFVYITGDCTGHGVPGAFMSLLNISKLSQTIIENKITRPDQILNNVRKEIIEALNPAGSKTESKDGMDAILCKLDLKKQKLEYAAANNSFYVIRNGGIVNCKADKMPVGKGHDDSIPFAYNEMQLEKGDVIYTFTDGYADQFGGPKGKKFKYKQLEELLLKICGMEMAVQKQELEKEFELWKRDLEQVDDVCVMGVRIV